MKLFRAPTLKAATQSTAFQRLFAFSMMLAMVSTVLLWPQIRNHAGEAFAQAQDNNYQPFECGQASSTSRQIRRSNLQMFNNSGLSGYTSGRAYPCVSGVAWKLEAGNTKRNLSAAGTYQGNNGIVALISKIYPESGGTMNFAGAGSKSTVHMSLASLRFCTGVPAIDGPVNFANGMGCVRRVDGVKMYADSATSPTVKPTVPYVLNITPNGPITVGGAGVLTDMWMDPGSVLAAPISSVPLGTLGCGSAGVAGNTYGSGSNQTCEFEVSKVTSGLAQNLAAGQNFAIVGMNVTFYYLMSHAQGSTNPYNTAELTLNSIQLPNTRIKVGTGS